MTGVVDVGLWDSVRRMTGLDRRDGENRGGEGDVPVDSATARSRPTGGVPDTDAQNPNATTGTTPNDTFVGRAGADESDVRPSAGELMAEQEKAARGDTDPGGAARST